MSSSMNSQGMTKRGNKKERNEEDTENKITEDVTVEQESWTKSLKYCYNRFRYYHFYIADKIETFLGVISLLIIKLYFFLMGYGPVVTEPRNVIENE